MNFVLATSVLLLGTLFSYGEAQNFSASGIERTFFIPLPGIPIPRPQPAATTATPTRAPVTSASTAPPNSVCNRCCKQYCPGSTLCDLSATPSCTNAGTPSGTPLSCLNNLADGCTACPLTARCSLSCGAVLGQAGAQLAFCPPV